MEINFCYCYMPGHAHNECFFLNAKNMESGHGKSNP
jgi:hypothetical protein